MRSVFILFKKRARSLTLLHLQYEPRVPGPRQEKEEQQQQGCRTRVVAERYRATAQYYILISTSTRPRGEGRSLRN